MIVQVEHAANHPKGLLNMFGTNPRSSDYMRSLKFGICSKYPNDVDTEGPRTTLETCSFILFIQALRNCLCQVPPCSFRLLEAPVPHTQIYKQWQHAMERIIKGAHGSVI